MWAPRAGSRAETARKRGGQQAAARQVAKQQPPAAVTPPQFQVPTNLVPLSTPPRAAPRARAAASHRTATAERIRWDGHPASGRAEPGHRGPSGGIKKTGEGDEAARTWAGPGPRRKRRLGHPPIAAYRAPVPVAVPPSLCLSATLQRHKPRSVVATFPRRKPRPGRSRVWIQRTRPSLRLRAASV